MILLRHFSLPLVAREMRSQARSKGAFVLRCLVVLGLLAPMVIWGALNRGRLDGGAGWFAFLSCVIFYGLMILSPMIVAGCLTSEREGGTLGLLFLSSLRSLDIVTGKFTSNILYLLVIAIAGFPVLATTIMMGGVTWAQVTGAGISILSLLVSTVGAAVFASAVCLRTQPAVMLTYFYVGILNFGIPTLNAWLNYKFNISLPDWAMQFSVSNSIAEQFTWTHPNYLSWAGWTFAFAGAQAVIFLGIAAWWLPGTLAVTGQESLWRWKWRHRAARHFVTFGRWGTRIRNRNPLLWLEWRRLTVASLATIVFVLVGGICWLGTYIGNNDSVWAAVALGIPCHIIVAALAVSGICREVSRERRERTLELLLCTPLEERSIVWARFKGAWLRYGMLYIAISIPAFVATFWFYFSDTVSTGDQEMVGIALLEFVEDFSFFCMAFAVSFRMALFSKTATSAILRSVATIAGVILGWGFAAYAAIAFVSMSRLFTGGTGSEDFLYVCMYGMFIIKIIIEFVIFRMLMGRLPDQLREQCGLSSDAM